MSESQRLRELVLEAQEKPGKIPKSIEPPTEGHDRSWLNDWLNEPMED